MTTGARVCIAFRRCVIRLKNTHTDGESERGKTREDKVSDLLVRNNKHTDDSVTVVILRQMFVICFARRTDQFVREIESNAEIFRSVRRTQLHHEIPKTLSTPQSIETDGWQMARTLIGKENEWEKEELAQRERGRERKGKRVAGKEQEQKEAEEKKIH